MGGQPGGSDDAVATVAVLSDDVRRSLYVYVRGASRPVTRSEAAVAVGVSGKLAAFHLEKLVASGLLRVHADRPAARLPRPGRAPKLYEPSDVEIRLNIPPREYDLMAEILLDAIRRRHRNARTSALRAARERGASIGREARRRVRAGRLGIERAMRLAREVLAAHGYEPTVAKASGQPNVRLRNCPFQRLVTTDRELVCGLNQSLIAGMLDGLGADRLEAVLAPEPGLCCVALRPAPRG
jgi:predicted ArsR family transcriptional regulator